MKDDTTYFVRYEGGKPVLAATAPKWHKKAIRAFVDIVRAEVVDKAEYKRAMRVMEDADAAAQDGGAGDGGA